MKIHASHHQNKPLKFEKKKNYTYSFIYMMYKETILNDNYLSSQLNVFYFIYRLA